MSYFSVLAPDMIKDMKIEDFSKVGAIQQKQIVKAFITFWTWFRAMNEELDKDDTEKEEEIEEGKDTTDSEK
jgi:hypothetical protein